MNIIAIGLNQPVFLQGGDSCSLEVDECNVQVNNLAGRILEPFSQPKVEFYKRDGELYLEISTPRKYERVHFNNLHKKNVQINLSPIDLNREDYIKSKVEENESLLRENNVSAEKIHEKSKSLELRLNEILPSNLVDFLTTSTFK